MYTHVVTRGLCLSVTITTERSPVSYVAPSSRTRETIKDADNEFQVFAGSPSLAEKGTHSVFNKPSYRVISRPNSKVCNAT